MATSPAIIWFRRDLRLGDHPALSAAVARGGPVIPVFIHDDLSESLKAAPKWRLGLGVAHLRDSLRAAGSDLILRRGPASEVLGDLIAETGAGAVYWSRLYDPDSVERDSAIKSSLKEKGIDARSYGGHLMFEPWTVATQQGAFYKVFTPFWKSVRTRDVDRPLARPSRIPAPQSWPASDRIEDWQLGADMRRGVAVVRPYVRLGEDAARDRLETFCEDAISRYSDARDLPAVDGTSALSENLSLGEISPHVCWHAGRRAMEEGKPGAETFLKELVWREFAYHLMHHTPHILTDNWKEDWNAFGWNENPDTPEVRAWKQGRTGVEFVDAAMREMYVTGRMHNRGRMIVASFLTKHLLTHWKIGLDWFEDCLIDWDPAANAMGWQWSAGSGPDATPYFRVFNPVTQRDKFDRDARYVRRWVAEGQGNPPGTALSYFDAVPRSWNLSPSDRYPAPVISAEAGRKRALHAYESRDF